MHAYLIVGAETKTRKDHALELARTLGVKDHANLWFILDPEDPEESIKISGVRALIQWANLASQEPRAVLIADADRLTLPAQHALLKTLEEPLGRALFFLTARSEQSLLPTIRSRCRVVRLRSVRRDGHPSDILRSLPSSKDPPARLKWMYEQANRTTAARAGSGLDWKFSPFQGVIPRSVASGLIESLIEELSDLTVRPTLKKSLRGACLMHAARAHRRLKQNVLTFLVLEQLALDIPSLD